MSGECSLHEEYGGGSLRTFLARIIEGDPRRGARVDLSLDLWPKALSLNGGDNESWQIAIELSTNCQDGQFKGRRL